MKDKQDNQTPGEHIARERADKTLRNADGPASLSDLDTGKILLKSGRLEEALEAFNSAYSLNPSSASLIGIFKAFKKARVTHGDPIKVAFLASFTLGPFLDHLKFQALMEGFNIEPYVGGFNRIDAEIINDNGPLYEFEPDVVMVMARGESLVPDFDPLRKSAPDPEEIIGAVASKIEILKQRTNAALLVDNLPLPRYIPFGIGHYRSPYYKWEEIIKIVNSCLFEIYRDDPRVTVADVDFIYSSFGRERVRSEKMWSLGGFEFSEEFLPRVAKYYLSFLYALKGRTAKCLVLDLDNTLWGGVVGEVGLDGIELGPHAGANAFMEFQRLLLHLWERGILLAVNSKNNEVDAMRVIREHPHMLLRESHFAAIKINWTDKATNIEEIAKELNIGLDSMIFLDDNPTERDWVRRRLPEVRVVDLPRDPSYYRKKLESLLDFSALRPTSDDFKRGRQYHEERERKKVRATAVNFEEFLESLNMVIRVERAERGSLPRITQLINKTNQFNLTVNRYTEGQVTGFFDSSDHRLYSLAVSDRFGDSGMVGVALVSLNSGPPELDLFLMSCRIMGRKIEFIFLKKIMEDLIGQGHGKIVGLFKPGPKNSLVKDFYAKAGFKPIGEDRWAKEICPEDVVCPDYCDVHDNFNL